MSRIKSLLDKLAKDKPGVTKLDQPIDWKAYEEEMQKKVDEWNAEDRRRVAEHNKRIPSRPKPLK